MFTRKDDLKPCLRYLDVEIISNKCLEKEMGEKVEDGVSGGNFVPTWNLKTG